MTLLTIRSRNSSICSRSVISSNTSGSLGSGSRGREGSLIGTLTGSRDGRAFSDDGLRVRAIRGSLLERDQHGARAREMGGDRHRDDRDPLELWTSEIVAGRRALALFASLAYHQRQIILRTGMSKRIGCRNLTCGVTPLEGGRSHATTEHVATPPGSSLNQADRCRG